MAAPKAKLGTKWIDLTGIRSARAKAQSNRKAQQNLLDNLKQKLSQRQLDVEGSLSGIPSKSNQIVAEAVSGYRQELRRESQDARLAFVQTAGGLREEMQSVSNHYQSSPQMLARYTLGSEKRSRIIHQIEHSGPAELASLAELAAATNDKDLAAALCSKAYQIEPTKRPFDAVELADVILGEELKEIRAAFDEIERLAVEAVTEDTAFETGRRNASRDMHIALMQQEANASQSIEKDTGSQNA